MRIGWIFLAALAVSLAAGCGEDETFSPIVLDELDAGGRKCGKEEAPEIVFVKQGVLASAEWWSCPRPQSGTDGAAITSLEGTTEVVTGSVAPLLLHWDLGESLAGQGVQSLKGRHLIFWYGSPRGSGYFRIPIDSEENPLPIELFVNLDANGGSYSLNFGVDEGTGSPEAPVIGALLVGRLGIIEVGGGDVQVNLTWDSAADLDLHLTDPDGEAIWYGARVSQSGGRLDLDSNAACAPANERGLGNENVYWPAGEAPEGKYVAAVDLFDDCGTFDRDIGTHYRVTVIRDRTDIQMVEGAFTPQDRPDGGYPMQEAVRFGYPVTP